MSFCNVGDFSKPCIQLKTMRLASGTDDDDDDEDSVAESIRVGAGCLFLLNFG